MLRADAWGAYAAEAAVELLIAHEWWLHRDDFVNTFVATDPTGSDMPAAWIDWTGAVAALDAGRLPSSSGEAQILRVAASIAAGVPVDLRHALMTSLTEIPRCCSPKFPIEPRDGAVVLVTECS